MKNLTKAVATAVIIFQLIGCAKQPAIVTNQNEINRLKAETEKNYKEAIFWNSLVVIGITIVAIYLRRLTNEMTEIKRITINSQTKLTATEKKVEEIEQHTINSQVRLTVAEKEAGGRKHEEHKLKHEVRKLKLGQQQQQTDFQGNLNELRDAQKSLQVQQNDLSVNQETLKQEQQRWKRDQRTLKDKLKKLEDAQIVQVVTEEEEEEEQPLPESPLNK
jgi:hypothetical protein